MGNNAQPSSPPTPEAVDKAVKDLLSDRAIEFKAETIREPIEIIMWHFRNENIFEKVDDKFKASKVLLSFVFDPLFIRQILKIFKLLQSKL